MNIVVLCGGISTEREVSLWSAENVCTALRGKGHKAILVDVYLGRNDIDGSNAFANIISVEEELNIIREKAKNLDELKKTKKEFFGDNVIELCKQADIVFMALHGENGENGKVQAALDLFGVKYTGANYLSCGMAMDKAVTKMIFAAKGVPCAKSIAIKKNMKIKSLVGTGIEFPVVVKPSCGGSSIGVFFAYSENEFEKALDSAFEYEDEVIVEEKIVGKEFSCGVIEYNALPVIEIIPKCGEYDFKNKYTKGATDEICPANISEELTKKIQNAAVQAAKALGLDSYCRVDVLTDKDDNCYCLEANTLPGMTATSLLPQEAAVIGIDFPELCEKLMNITLSK